MKSLLCWGDAIKFRLETSGLNICTVRSYKKYVQINNFLFVCVDLANKNFPVLPATFLSWGRIARWLNDVTEPTCCWIGAVCRSCSGDFDLDCIRCLWHNNALRIMECAHWMMEATQKLPILLNKNIFILCNRHHHHHHRHSSTQSNTENREYK